MSSKVTLGIERSVIEIGYCSFSTNHDHDLVDKWVEEKGSDYWEGDVDEWVEQYTDKTCFDNDGDFQGGQGDEHCPYDDHIQKWIDEVKIDMNLIFSSGCEIQKITDFIKENEMIFNSMTKKKWEWELTEEEKLIFFKLRKLVGLPIPSNYKV